MYGVSIPASIIMIRPHAQPKFALRLNPSNQSEKEILPGNASIPVGYRQKRTRHRPSRVDELIEVGVIVVEYVR